MHCPHCGNEFKSAGLAPGGLVMCPACGKGFPDPNASTVPPPRGSAGVSVVGVLLVVGAVSVCMLLGVVGVLAALLIPAVGAAREAANRMACQNNLKQIGIAFHNYHDTYKAFPAQSVTDENGQPMHSWRVAILPFLEQSGLYGQYNFDEPWDSPNNRMVADQVLPVFQCPGSERTKGTNFTNYFVVYGDQTAFGPNRWTKIADMTDGTSNTILVVECDTMSVPWAEPADIPFDQMEFRLNPPTGAGVSSGHPGGANVLMGDGSVHFLSDQMDPQTFRYLLIPNDGNAVSTY